MKTRTFIALDMPDSVINEVERIQNILKSQKFTGKLTELENLHLTLKFLGEISDETLDRVKERLKGIKFGKLNLKLLHSGTFEYRGSPKIVWIRIAGASKLQKQIDEVLKDLFTPEKRFMSHLTIARIKHSKSPKEFSKYVKNMGVKQINWECNKFELNSSELASPGPIYTTLEEYISE